MQLYSLNRTFIRRLIFFLATMVALHSCASKSEIDKLQNQIDDLKASKIASIEQQITNIQTSISSLQATATQLSSFVSTLQFETSTLKADLATKEKSLNDKIEELKKYTDSELGKDKDWASATFATLEQYQSILTELASIKQSISDLDKNLKAEVEKAIADSEASMKGWVSDQLSGYYTIAQMDAKLKALADANAANESAIGKVASDLASAKTELTEAYISAITDAITKYNGEITAKIAADIKTATDALQKQIDALEDRVAVLEGMIQSVTIIPVRSDGSLQVKEGGNIVINCIITPFSVLKDLDCDNIKIIVLNVETKASPYSVLDVSSVVSNEENGVVEVTADLSSLFPIPDGESLMIAINVKTGKSDYISGFVKVADLEKKDWSILPDFKKVSNFPTIVITTDGPISSSRISGSFPYISGKVVFNDPDGMYSDVPVLECAMQIRKQGYATTTYPKCEYEIKLDKPSKVYGIEDNTDWAILAEWNDGTLLRNQTAMQVSRIVGMQWTPKCCGVEVTINGQKQGLFSFFENKETVSSKIHMGEGGYCLNLEDYEEDNGSCDKFTTNRYYKVIKFKEPDWPTSAQRSEVVNFFTIMENALAANSTSEDFQKYKELTNTNSFIRNYIVQELTKNEEGNLRHSTPLVLENNQLRVPMVWDFDLSLGNGEIDGWFPLEDVVSGTYTGIRTYRDGDGPTGWFVKCAGGRPYGWENPNGQTAWYQRMFLDSEFVTQLKITWNELYPNLKTVPAYSDALYDFYKEAIQREWTIWDSQNRSNRSGARKNTPQAQYDAMRKFYVDRLEWMNNAINKL